MNRLAQGAGQMDSCIVNRDDDIAGIIAAIENTVPAGREIDVTISSLCSKCRARIPVGSKAILVAGKGAYHTTCYNT